MHDEKCSGGSVGINNERHFLAQEVFTTNDCQVTLYAALSTDLVKVLLPGCLHQHLTK